MTFRVNSGGGTGTLTITPKIIISGPYQNVTAQAAAGAAADVPEHRHQAGQRLLVPGGAVTLEYGRLMFPQAPGAGDDGQHQERRPRW